MKSKWLLNLVLAALAVALGALAYYAPRGAEREPFALTRLGARDVTQIRIERLGDPPFVIERTADGWRLTAPIAAPADPHEVDRLLAILSARSPQRMPPIELARFDLASPPLAITFNDERLAFGMVNAVTREQYVASDDAIYVIEPRYAANVPEDALRLVRRRLLPEGARAVRIDLPMGRLEHGAGGWTLAPAPPGMAPDAAERLASDWLQATAGRVAHAGAEPALDQVRIALEGGNFITFDVVLRDPALVLRRPDLKLEYTLDPSAQRLLGPAGQMPRR